MTIHRLSRAAVVALLGALTTHTALGGEPTTSTRGRPSEAVRARQEADRQRLVAKLRDETPKHDDKAAKTNVLDLPIFHRYDRP